MSLTLILHRFQFVSSNCYDDVWLFFFEFLSKNDFLRFCVVSKNTEEKKKNIKNKFFIFDYLIKNNK